MPELVAASASLSVELLSGMLWLQAFVVVGFWSGILAATCSSDSFSFLPMDRHLRRLGLLGTLREPTTRIDFLRPGVGGHLLLQLLFGSVLLQHLGVNGWAGGAAGMLKLVIGYALVALMAAAALPPHRLPYQLGELPSCLHLGARSVHGLGLPLSVGAAAVGLTVGMGLGRACCELLAFL